MSLRDRTVLVVDDEPDLCEIVRRVLTRENATVVTATSVGEAVRLAEAHTGDLDLVITDMRMPGGTGVDLSDQIRLTRPTTAVIFMSGLPSYHESLTDLGPRAAVLSKPFTPAQLVAAATAALSTTTGA